MTFKQALLRMGILRPERWPEEIYIESSTNQIRAMIPDKGYSGCLISFPIMRGKCYSLWRWTHNTKRGGWYELEEIGEYRKEGEEKPSINCTEIIDKKP